MPGRREGLEVRVIRPHTKGVPVVSIEPGSAPKSCGLVAGQEEGKSTNTQFTTGGADLQGFQSGRAMSGSLCPSTHRSGQSVRLCGAIARQTCGVKTGSKNRGCLAGRLSAV